MTESSPDRPLRARAEALLCDRPEQVEHLSPAEAQRLIYEFRVHQIELELQNEELRHTQQELAVTRDRDLDLYEYAPVGYLTINKAGHILQANLTCERLLGTERKPLLQQSFAHFVARDAQEAYHFFRQRLQHADAPQTVELQMIHADGTTFWARLDATIATSMTPNTAEQEMVYRITVSDVTQVHLLQEQEQRMLYTVGHDLRVPATIIKGYLPFLLDLLPAKGMDDRERMIVEAMQRALHRMEVMVNDLSEATYLRSGQVTSRRNLSPCTPTCTIYCSTMPACWIPHA